MTITRLSIAAQLAAWTALLACSSQQVAVTHTMSSTQPLSGYRSYHLVVTPAPRASRTHWMVEASVHLDLRRKGYVPVDRGSADLLVTYDTDIASGGDMRVSQALDGSIGARPTTSKHLIILMTDTRTNQPVWRGDAKGEVKAGRLTQAVDSALHEILAAVPVRGEPAHQLR